MDNLMLSIIFFSHPKPLPRVLIPQYISLLPHCDMCINLCDVNRTVSEHFLNVADVYIGFQKAGGEGVAEHVRGDVQVNGGEGAVFVNHAANGLVGQGSAGLIHKKCAEEDISVEKLRRYSSRMWITSSDASCI